MLYRDFKDPKIKNTIGGSEEDREKSVQTPDFSIFFKIPYKSQSKTGKIYGKWNGLPFCIWNTAFLLINFLGPQNWILTEVCPWFLLGGFRRFSSNDTPPKNLENSNFHENKFIFESF